MACGFRSAGNWCRLKITPQNEALTKAKLPFLRSVINESCTRAVSPSLYLDTAWSYQRIQKTRFYYANSTFLLFFKQATCSHNYKGTAVPSIWTMTTFVISPLHATTVDFTIKQSRCG